MLPIPRPAWQRDAAQARCGTCGSLFNAIRRRHHCRGCGKLFCLEHVRRIEFHGMDKPQFACSACTRFAVSVESVSSQLASPQVTLLEKADVVKVLTVIGRQSQPHIEALALNNGTQGCGLLEEHAPVLGKALYGGLPGLRRLQLDYNRIGLDGARQLSAGMGHLPQLEELLLACAGLGVEGAAAVARGLRAAPRLRLLGLGSNDIGDSGAGAVASALEALPELQRLSLADNALTSEGARLLSEAPLPSLEALYLWGNSISDLPDALIRLPTLRLLDLDGNPLRRPLRAVAQEGLQAMREFLDALSASGPAENLFALVVLWGTCEPGLTVTGELPSEVRVARSGSLDSAGVIVVPLADFTLGLQRELRLRAPLTPVYAFEGAAPNATEVLQRLEESLPFKAIVPASWVGQPRLLQLLGLPPPGRGPPPHPKRMAAATAGDDEDGELGPVGVLPDGRVAIELQQLVQLPLSQPPQDFKSALFLALRSSKLLQTPFVAESRVTVGVAELEEGPAVVVVLRVYGDLRTLSLLGSTMRALTATVLHCCDAFGFKSLPQRYVVCPHCVLTKVQSPHVFTSEEVERASYVPVCGGVGIPFELLRATSASAVTVAPFVRAVLGADPFWALSHSFPSALQELYEPPRAEVPSEGRDPREDEDEELYARLDVQVVSSCPMLPY